MTHKYPHFCEHSDKHVVHAPRHEGEYAMRHFLDFMGWTPSYCHGEYPDWLIRGDSGAGVGPAGYWLVGLLAWRVQQLRAAYKELERMSA